MFITEVIIDGFKSYANRTVISGWDLSFNAITGLNGTGKSNILDAICFVLGISNLSQVRATNLQDLVYKQGQSRVVKASVTIVFDNSDSKASPVGYEQYKELTIARQVVIGGRNKYLINGVTAQQGRVQNLFHSVQLNVNNPHFLIMQGRITKVINMKPPEILGMIQEAAGTRMYETKKLAAQKTIAKKQTKVDEINTVLREELTPTLEKLRLERTSFMKWTANNTEIERIDRFCNAASFVAAQALVDSSEGEVKETEEMKKHLDDKHELLQMELEGKNKLLEEQKEAKSKALQGQAKELEKQVKQLGMVLVQNTTVWQNKKDSYEGEAKAQQELDKSLVELKKAIASKKKQCEEFEAKAKEMEKLHAAVNEQLASLQGQLLGFDVGNSKQAQGTVAEQLMETQKKIAQLEGGKTSAVTKLKHLKAQIATKSKSAAAAEKDYKTVEKDLKAKEVQLVQVETELKGVQSDPAARTRLEEEIATRSQTVSDLREKVDASQSSLNHLLNFDYSSPSRDFDRKKVKGLLIRLVSVKDPKQATALEIAAGGKLYNVVVDSEQTGKDLLAKGNLKKRVTIIPLNKIARTTIAADVIAKAEALVGKENVNTAISLVGFEDDVHAAMQYVFGGTFICKDMKAAEKVTYSKEIRKKSVTLQGELFDPAGTITGGSAPVGGSVLSRLQQLNDLESAFEKEQKALAGMKKELSTLTTADEGTRDLVSQKEVLTHELECLRGQAAETTFAQANTEIEALKLEMKHLEENTGKAEAELAEQQEKAKDLEQSIKDFEGQRINKQQSIEGQITATKKKVQEASKAMKAADNEKHHCDTELSELTKEHDALAKQGGGNADKLEELKIEAQQLQKVVAADKKAYDAASARLDAEKDKLIDADREIGETEKARTKIQKKMADSQIEIKKLVHKLGRLQADKKEAQTRVQALLKGYEWIPAERQYFGKPGGDYDFEKVSPKKAEERLNKLRKEQEELSKKINKKVMGMFEKAEQEYQDLLKKRDIIMKDKAKIEEVILELDRKKNETLENTFKKVTTDFGSIFKALLPGAQARLAPPSGGTVLDGLEILVAFGDSWKESLSELSGGQRSLLALSLILALLLYKPAPMYILDEVDAALDLSHTQNIGHMLKTHFPQSQFIVVSLKEGMFNNANVIFRTKFVDGVSAVTRTANKSR